MPKNDLPGPPATPPVFVDDTGRRHRLVRLAGYALALLTVAYLALMGLSMVSSPDVAPLAIPGLGRLFPGPAAPSIVVAGHSRRPGDVVGHPGSVPTAVPAAAPTTGGVATAPVPTLTPAPTLAASGPTASRTPAPAATTPATSASPTAIPSTRPPAPTSTPSVTRGTGSPTAHPTPHSRAQPAGGSPSPTAT